MFDLLVRIITDNSIEMKYLSVGPVLTITLTLTIYGSWADDITKIDYLVTTNVRRFVDLTLPGWTKGITDIDGLTAYK